MPKSWRIIPPYISKMFIDDGVPPPKKCYPNIKNHPKKSRRDNDMKSVVIDSLRRELLIRNKQNLPLHSFFSASIQKGPKFTQNPPFWVKHT
jgi:hypothetical protein